MRARRIAVGRGREHGTQLNQNAHPVLHASADGDAVGVGAEGDHMLLEIKVRRHLAPPLVAKARGRQAVGGDGAGAGLAARADQKGADFLAHLVVAALVLPRQLAVDVVAHLLDLALNGVFQRGGCGQVDGRWIGAGHGASGSGRADVHARAELVLWAGRRGGCGGGRCRGCRAGGAGSRGGRHWLGRLGCGRFSGLGDWCGGLRLGLGHRFRGGGGFRLGQRVWCG
ncbi:hypothetical protein SDC9_124744 [bioreactor metagenome]|uniref:Uncharacterized protein n=1 Tax=bioreactor metagenome TaxID=1076179 RepID=A0A645CL91_9ZZZZ